MTPEHAEWVRANAWTAAMRKQHRDVPRAASTCSCQAGLTHWCRPDIGRHDRCHRATPQPTWETIICDRSGVGSMHHAEPHRHPTPSATGPRRTQAALVWLADRTCRWICPCPHHVGAQPPAAPTPTTAPRYGLVVLPGFEQLDLLGVGPTPPGSKQHDPRPDQHTESPR
ncbi:DUF6248 family natural product biosynthesis protein [Streptosporangium sp. NPDC050855]|uniref:DUF6248 family natural product biosynthesis protein n=1 Tax=Streptosporangium sp. NPDC050855 TaxID=3366194 RepID=UPI0037B0CAB0